MENEIEERLRNGEKPTKVVFDIPYWRLTSQERKLFFFFFDYVISTRKSYGCFDRLELCRRIYSRNFKQIEDDVFAVGGLPAKIRIEYGNGMGGVKWETITGNLANFSIGKERITDLKTGEKKYGEYVRFSTLGIIPLVAEELAKYIEITNSIYSFSHNPIPYEDIYFNKDVLSD